MPLNLNYPSLWLCLYSQWSASKSENSALDGPRTSADPLCEFMQIDEKKPASDLAAAASDAPAAASDVGAGAVATAKSAVEVITAAGVQQHRGDDEDSDLCWEFLVKFRDRGYIHCKWVTDDTLKAAGKLVPSLARKVQNFLRSPAAEGVRAFLLLTMGWVHSRYNELLFHNCTNQRSRTSMGVASHGWLSIDMICLVVLSNYVACVPSALRFYDPPSQFT